MENSSPWSPLHKIRVLRPRPKSPLTPSSMIINFAASAANCLVYFRGPGVIKLTVRDFGIVDLAVSLYNSQRIGNRIRNYRGNEPDKGKPRQPHSNRMFWRLVEILWQKIILNLMSTLHVIFVVTKEAYSSKPGVMSHESCSSGCECTPPQTSKPVWFDSLSK